METTRKVQPERGFRNPRPPSKQIREYGKLDEAVEKTLEEALQRLKPSAWAQDRYRSLDRTYRV